MTDAIASEHPALSDRDRDSAILVIGGMTCGSCANAVHRALSRVPGVGGVGVDLRSGRALVQGSARPENLIAAVEEAGYRAAPGPDVAPLGRPKGGGCGCGC